MWIASSEAYLISFAAVATIPGIPPSEVQSAGMRFILIFASSRLIANGSTISSHGLRPTRLDESEPRNSGRSFLVSCKFGGKTNDGDYSLALTRDLAWHRRNTCTSPCAPKL